MDDMLAIQFPEGFRIVAQISQHDGVHFRRLPAVLAPVASQVFAGNRSGPAGQGREGRLVPPLAA
jgi:hypothetical protein